MKKTSPFNIVYEDERIIAVNKASGIAVCADRWDDSKERLDRLLAEHLGCEKIFIVHRIDRDTSGMVVFAKDADTHKKLSMAFEGRAVKKRYIAAVHGRAAWKETICDLPLVPNGNKKHLTIIDKYQGKKSITAFRVLGSTGNYSIIEAVPETGRTHQIRVHLASLGSSVICDELYGNAKPLFLSAFKPGWRGDPTEERPILSRLGLHAVELILPGKLGFSSDLVLKAPLPRDMAAVVRQMEKCTGSSYNIE
ncbi:MAG: RluA family pseudouridine synthase [Treponema sp.]|jgi:23S rRNA pseudouridine1911/1915/1917 synthase|nr:RluA family pseudouridine synthase [Treponema sp.]